MQLTSHGLVMIEFRQQRYGCLSAVLRRGVLIFAVVAIAWFGAAVRSFAQDLSALARLDVAGASFEGSATDISIVLPISQPVPWRARLLTDPPRLVMDFREVDFAQIEAVPIRTAQIKAVRAGVFRSGWSRLVLELDGPYQISVAEMKTGEDKAQVVVRLTPTDGPNFARLAGAPEPEDWLLPKSVAKAALPRRLDGPLVVVLDPGHGGIDPGAERDEQKEADLMLGFARQLKELLLREGLFKVVMTREEDVFVPLEARISIARVEGADVLISLHADALEEGQAVGAVIYTLSDDASAAAAATLAERHDRDDLLSGINLAGQDDLVATVLMDMARTETMPRTARLASALEDAMVSAELKMHRLPRQSAGFSVLKSPEIPSVLLELGFLSNPRDLARLTDKKWRGRMAEAIRDGVMIWAQEDAALQGLLRK